MIEIKEDLKRIKRGELQLFVPIVEQFLDSVYNTAQDKFGPEQAEFIVANVFKKLYISIVRYYYWQNPERFIHRSLSRACSALKLKWLPKSPAIEQKAPAQVMRSVLLGLSQISKRKRQLNAMVTGAVFLLVPLVVISFLLALQPHRQAEGTVYTDNIEPKSIVAEPFWRTSFQVEKTVSSITRLGAMGMAVDIYQADGKHYVEIWVLGKLLKTIQPPKHCTFVTGDLETDTYIFREGGLFWKYDSSGKKLDSLKVEGHLVSTSPNNKFLVFEEAPNSFAIIDTLNLAVKEKVAGELFSITDTGSVLFRNEQIDFLPEGYNQDNRIRHAVVDPRGYIAAVFENGIIGVYHENEMVWEAQITFPTVGSAISRRYPVERAFILAGEKQLNVIIEYENGSFFQSFDNQNGQAAVDTNETWHSCEVVPRPLISSDHRVLAYASQITDNNKSVRYAGIFNTYTRPMREIKLDLNRQLVSWNIENSGDEYYIYLFSNTPYYEVVHIDMSD